MATKGTDFTKNPKGPATGSGGKPPDFARMDPPKREASYPKPDPDIPVPAGGEMPFKPPVYAQPALGGTKQPALPYKNLKG